MAENGFSGAAMLELLRRARTCSLSTLSHADGTPYVSLANIATDRRGWPIVLISELAWHTQNLLGDPRASVLAAELPGRGDALAGPRVTVLGRFERCHDAEVQSLYLLHHPEAKLYADFTDFGFWLMQPMAIHGVAGFGRIQTLAPEDVFTTG